MNRFTRDLLFYKLPPVLYALAIMSLSLWSQTRPPIDFGVPWEDKIYHFAEYLIFGFLIFRAFPNYRRYPRRNRYLAGLILFGLVYAALDEVVQYFVPGRDSSVGDWLADACGYLLAASIMICCYGRRQRTSDSL